MRFDGTGLDYRAWFSAIHVATLDSPGRFSFRCAVVQIGLALQTPLILPSFKPNVARNPLWFVVGFEDMLSNGL